MVDPASELRNPKTVIFSLVLRETIKVTAKGTSSAALASLPLKRVRKGVMVLI